MRKLIGPTERESCVYLRWQT
ncbi:prepilin peptidase A domain protein, partial [Escherichia coli]